MTDTRPLTVFADIDGTLIKHTGDIVVQSNSVPKVLPGVLDKLREWDLKGYKIILTTGRRESCREATIKQLQKAGIFYDQLIMGIGGGGRVVLNDRKPDGNRDTAFAINVDRNAGLEDIDI
jgi:hydroxymethylpyrimidine pyrophosphatase-like HAD family hydrolase